MSKGCSCRHIEKYIQNIAHALLRTGRAADESSAIQLAIGAIQRWSRGGGRVSPEVRAAAAKALAQWEAAKATAHSHSREGGDAVSLSWNGVEGIDLAMVAASGGAATPARPRVATAAQVDIATGATGPRAKPAGGGKGSQGNGGGSFDSLHPRVAAGNTGGGRFARKGTGTSSTSGGGSGAAKAKTATKAKAPAQSGGKMTPPRTGGQAKATAKPKAKILPGGPNPNAKTATRQQALAQRGALLKQAADDRAKAKDINAQIATLTAAIHAAVKARAGQKAAKPGTTTSTSASGTTSAASTSAKAASATSKASTASSAASTTRSRSSTKTATVAQMRTRRRTLRARVVSLKSHAASLDKQAAAIKLASDATSPVLELAFAEALAERVPPGKPEGGQFATRNTQLTRHDTPEQAAKAINAMDPRQRAAVRRATLPPPGFEWSDTGRLAVARTEA